MEHVVSGTELFRVICDKDMEGVVAKQASARYTPEATTWVKIKNRSYSQAVGREEFFAPPEDVRSLKLNSLESSRVIAIIGCWGYFQ